MLSELKSVFGWLSVWLLPGENSWTKMKLGASENINVTFFLISWFYLSVVFILWLISKVTPFHKVFCVSNYSTVTARMVNLSFWNCHDAAAPELLIRLTLLSRIWTQGGPCNRADNWHLYRLIFDQTSELMNQAFPVIFYLAPLFLALSNMDVIRIISLSNTWQ